MSVLGNICVESTMLSWLLLISSFLLPHPLSSAYVTTSSVNYTLVGDLNLGGIIPLHTYNEIAEECDTLRSDSLKKLEAMVYAVKLVNQNETLLPNVTLGFEIYDTCSYDARTLRESLNFIPSKISPGDGCVSSSEPRQNLPIVGVIGAQRSSSSVQAALLLELYHIPQISYLSTSDELSDDVRFPYFLRTVGPDSYQIRAIVDILLHYDWKYVSFISSDDTYGRNGETEFTQFAAENGICIGLLKKVTRFDSGEEYNELVKELMTMQQQYSATVVVLFVHLKMAQNMFSAATRMNAQRRFVWIGSDSWANYGEEAVIGNEEAALGSFSVIPASEIHPEYNDYFRSLTPSTSNNPWLLEFLQHFTNCTDCDQPGLLEAQDSDVSIHETLVMDSVMAFAHALDAMRRDLCPDILSGVCDEMKSADGAVLRDYLLQVDFMSPNGRVNFQENGDVVGRYSIRYFHEDSDNAYKFSKVGKWDEGADFKTFIHDNLITWYVQTYTKLQGLNTGPQPLESNSVPKSICSEPCGVGERINVDIDNSCCWTCTKCYDHEIVTTNGTNCQSCIDDQNKVYAWPNRNATECQSLDPNQNIWSYAVIAASAVGLILAIVIFALYVYNHENALIKASSRELSYIMFIGIFLAYFTALMLGVHPTLGVCVIRRLGRPISTSLIYVPLAVKTFRLFRIFKASVKSAKRPKFIRPKSQVMLALIITSIPVLWTIIWLIVAPPRVIHDMPYENQPHVQVGCSSSPVGIIGIHAWNLIVILVCSILAFLTRKLPENYNETKFITFCAFCSFIVFLAFSSTNLTVTELYYQAGYTALALTVNASMILVCLFFVKLYAIYFVRGERWNVKNRSADYQAQELKVADTNKFKGPPASVARVNVGDHGDNVKIADSTNGNQVVI